MEDALHCSAVIWLYFVTLKSTRVAMKVEACKAEQMPEMEAELAFPLSTKELFVTQDADADSHLETGNSGLAKRACYLVGKAAVICGQPKRHC